MNKSKQFYKTLPPKVLHEYAEKGGLGYEDPVDLKEFLKFIKSGDYVLEIGCGTGRIGKHLINEKYVGLETNQDYANFFIEKIDEKYKNNINNIDFLDFKSDQLFDVILFPWSVFWDFTSEEQKEIIKKSLELLNEDGRILIDNPAKESVYNSVDGYEPNLTYYEDLVEFLNTLNIKKYYKENYETKVGRLRELIVLEK
jgi:SAM-dependent methyltransferase